MAHDHSHQHDASEYYIEQLCSIGFGGLLAAIVCKWYFSGTMLKFMAPQLTIVVLVGGLGLLALILYRAVVIWNAAGQPQVAHAHDHGHGHSHGHDHAHEHGPGCQHDHAQEHAHGIQSPPAVRAPVPHSHGVAGHEHEHPVAPEPLGQCTATPHAHGGAGHDHDHAWAPWRYMIMLVPIILGFLGLPADGLQPYPGNETDPGALVNAPRVSVSATSLVGMMLSPDGPAPLMTSALTVSFRRSSAKPEHTDASADGNPPEEDLSVNYSMLIRARDYVERSFKQLEEATLTEAQRNHFTGMAVSVTGQFAGDNDRYFSLTRYKINCCGADAIPLQATIAIDYSQMKNGPRLEPAALTKQWVRVKGVLQFKDRGRGNYMVMIVVTPSQDEPLSELVKVIKTPANPYLD